MVTVNNKTRFTHRNYWLQNKSFSWTILYPWLHIFGLWEYRKNIQTPYRRDRDHFTWEWNPGCYVWTYRNPRMLHNNQHWRSDFSKWWILLDKMCKVSKAVWKLPERVCVVVVWHCRRRTESSGAVKIHHRRTAGRPDLENKSDSQIIYPACIHPVRLSSLWSENHESWSCCLSSATGIWASTESEAECVHPSLPFV